MNDLQKTFNKYLLKLKNGEDVFEEFYYKTSAYIEHIAYKYLNDKQNIGDVISETYIQVLERIDAFDPDKNGYAWMYTIAKNLAYNYNVRTNRDNEFKQSRSREASEVAACDNDMIGRYDLEMALLKLDEQERALVELVVFEEKSYRQIAAELGLSVSAAYRRCRRAVGKLQKLLRNTK